MVFEQKSPIHRIHWVLWAWHSSSRIRIRRGKHNSRTYKVVLQWLFKLSEVMETKMPCSNVFLYYIVTKLTLHWTVIFLVLIKSASPCVWSRWIFHTDSFSLEMSTILYYTALHYILVMSFLDLPSRLLFKATYNRIKHKHKEKWFFLCI